MQQIKYYKVILFRSLASLSVLFGQVVRGVSAGSRVLEYMELRPQVALRGGHTLPKHKIRGAVSFEGVSFVYPSRPEQAVLRDLSLHLPAGKVTALCGLSGAGEKPHPHHSRKLLSIHIQASQQWLLYLNGSTSPRWVW